MQIKLFRGQIKTYYGSNGADVTAKSATGLYKRLAPSWEIVMLRKQRNLSEDAYAALYETHLEKAADDKIPEKIHAHLQPTHDNVCLVLLCYCNPNAFCHVDLLIEWLCLRYPQLYINANDRVPSPMDALLDFS
jgi:hypothetical protein